MAWPFDARDKSYVAGDFVPSANLNEIQDRIVQVFEPRKVFVFDPIVPVTGAYALTFGTSPASATYWTAYAAGSTLYYALRVQGGPAKVLSCEVKAYQAGATAFQRIAAYRLDGKFDDAGVGPQTLLQIGSGTMGWGSATWGEVTVPCVADVTEEHQIVVEVVAGASGDRVGGVQFELANIRST